MEKILVSVIIPVHNGETYIAKCFDSVLQQSYNPLEIIVIDDGSTDQSCKILADYGRHDSRISLYHQENQGVSSARNAGISHSHGEVILFLDIDDLLTKNAINSLVKAYAQHGADVVIGNFNKIVNNKIIPSEHHSFFSGGTLLGEKELSRYLQCYFMKPNRFPLFVYSWGRLFKADIIRKNKIKFDTDLKTYEDVKFNFQYMPSVKSVHYISDIICLHRVHDNYSSATSFARNPEDLFGYLSALEQASIYDSAGKYANEIAHAYIVYTIIQLVRLSGQIQRENFRRIYAYTRQLVRIKNIRQNIAFYRPTEGDSRVVPFLIKFRLVLLTLYVCNYKARKRY